MRFDKFLTENGVTAACRLENGKVYVEWKFQVQDDMEAGRIEADETETGRIEAGWAARSVLLRLTDGQGNLVLECVQDMEEEEPLVSVLMQPRLWNGVQDPYLYRMEAAIRLSQRERSLSQRERSLSQRERFLSLWELYHKNLDHITGYVPLRSIGAASQTDAQILLNGSPVTLRAVRYLIPPAHSEAERQRRMLQDLQRLLDMGANCICVENICEGGRFLLNLCDRLGFFACLPRESCSREGFVGENSSQDMLSSGKLCRESKCLVVYGSDPEVVIERPAGIPFFRGGTGSLLMQGSDSLSSLYYQYKARWSAEPFVYLAPESLARQKDGDYEVCCYSSCDRVALYSDGLLFEVKRGGKGVEGREYFFQGIPARGPVITLTAEGEGCSQSLTIHKTLVSLKRDGMGCTS